MNEVLTESEITTFYEMKQREDFPRRKNVMGMLLACLFIGGSMCVVLGVFALLMKIFNV